MVCLSCPLFSYTSSDNIIEKKNFKMGHTAVIAAIEQNVQSVKDKQLAIRINPKINLSPKQTMQKSRFNGLSGSLC